MNRIVELAIGFDEGTLDFDELGEFAELLVATGLVNSTGTYQRFVRDWRESADEYVDEDIFRGDR